MIRSANYILPVVKSLEVLEESGIKFFPVSFASIFARFRSEISIMTYSRFRESSSLSHYDVIKNLGSKHGASIRIGFSCYLILYNDDLSEEIQRTTIAHELGHIFLRHHDEAECDMITEKEIDAELYDVMEKEAWCFARNLLCPIYSTYKLLEKNGYMPSLCEDNFHTKWEQTVITNYIKNLSTRFSAGYLLERAFHISEVAAKTRLDLSGADIRNIKKTELLPTYDEHIVHKAGWKCNSCNTERLEGAVYCTECGRKGRFVFYRDITKRYPPIEKNEDNKILKCLRCGNNHISHGAIYCSQCGGPLYNRCNGTVHHLNHSEAKFCAECGSYTEYGVFYNKHGEFINIQEIDMDNERVVPFDQNTLKVEECPRCGNAEFSEDATYCKKCGLELTNKCIQIQVSTDNWGDPIFAQQHDNPPDARYCEHCGQPTVYLAKGVLKSWDGKYEEQKNTPKEQEFEDFPESDITF